MQGDGILVDVVAGHGGCGEVECEMVVVEVVWMLGTGSGLGEDVGDGVAADVVPRPST